MNRNAKIQNRSRTKSIEDKIEKKCPKCDGVLNEGKKAKTNLIKCLDCDYEEEFERNKK
ncbi:MAG: hypothetical protein ACLU31_02765 [Ezakiella sp.]